MPGTLGDNVQCVSTGQPLANITVNLFKDFDANGVPDGPVFQTTQTNASGFYQFTGLEVALAGGANTTRYIVRVDTADPDLGACNVPIPPTSYNPPLTSTNPNDPNNDFRFETPARYTLGDRVWYDQNQNGIQDPNEPGYNGVTVQLFPNATCAGAPSATTTTAAGPGAFGDGYYQFTNLLAGPYCVQFNNLPAGWFVSPANQGDDVGDSDADPATRRITNINLTANDPREDMGIYVPGTLGDNVRCVSTGQGLANITVLLYRDFNGDGVADGPAIATRQTDATGFYQFTGLEVALTGDPNNTTRYIVEVDTADPDLGTCNVPIPPTRYNPPLTSTNPNDPNNDFRFEKPLTCGLVIDKKCAVTQPPPSQWVCSDAKPIDALSMIWNGTQPVKIKAWKGAVNSTLLASIDNVVPGQKVTVAGFAGAPNDVIWEIFAAGTTTKLGNSTFHLSCSDVDMTGPEDCGKAEGDGKGQTGFINTWKLEGMAGNGQSFLCTPPATTPTDRLHHHTESGSKLRYPGQADQPHLQVHGRWLRSQHQPAGREGDLHRKRESELARYYQYEQLRLLYQPDDGEPAWRIHGQRQQVQFRLVLHAAQRQHRRAVEDSHLVFTGPGSWRCLRQLDAGGLQRSARRQRSDLLLRGQEPG